MKNTFIKFASDHRSSGETLRFLQKCQKYRALILAFDIVGFAKAKPL